MDRIGKYELRQLLGEGATSAVYLAYDTFTQRDVAIKQLYPEVLKDPERGRLYRHLLINEASLAGRLSHPHIAQIYDATVDEAQGYVVMEYVPGGTLEPFCRPDRLLPFDRVIEIVFKATRALDYAYHQGITHRDIKPANILLDHPDGQDIKLSDFGAALFNTADTTQISGVGSPAYMSPQQVREMPLNHQTDIYSLGVVMYQLLTGRLPFEASNNYSLLYRIAHETPPAPIALRPDIPAELDAIVRRAMQKSLDDRYQNWVEFSHDLAHAFRNLSLGNRKRAVSDTQKFETLRRLSFFRDFTDIEIWEIVRFSEWRFAEPGTTLLKEGEPGDHFCFLANGEARVKKQDRLLHLLTPGDCFGEMAVFAPGNGLRTASVEATSEVEIITIRARALQRASDTCRMHFYKAFLEVLAGRLSMTSARVAHG
ncbi:protein kinase domain-containing protein [Denitromonas sp.]|uniref:protein kinase domain-containing protein n=1 Tax=Denitromonas sp. TaxID=2734609 RepID=UPI003A89C8A5